MNIGPDIAPRAIVADKGYASKANRAAARARGIAPVIPHKANEKNKPAFFAKAIYKGRGRIEQAFGGHVRQDGVISGVAMGHRQAALAVMCSG